MFRLILRLFLIVYALLPIVAIILLFTLVRQIEADLAPVYENAAEALADAAEGLQDGVEDLESTFQPLVSAVNSLRSAVNTSANFLTNSVNDAIDWIDDTTFGVIDLPRFNGINLPPLVNLSGLDEIADNVQIISQQVSLLAATTQQTFNARLDTLMTALTLIVVWLVLGFVLFVYQSFAGLWRP